MGQRAEPFLKIADAVTTAPDAAPTAATDGFPLSRLYGGPMGVADVAALCILQTTEGGTPAVMCKVWVYEPKLAAWLPLGTAGSDADKGRINGGTNLGVTSTDTIAHTEPLSGLSAFERIFLEVETNDGTTPVLNAYLKRIKQ